MKKTPGMVLIFSLLILSLMMLLTQQLLRSVYVGSNFIQTMVDRERAEMLVLGGLNVAMQRLQMEEQKKGQQQNEQQEGDDDKKKKLSPAQKWLQRNYAYMNRWYTVRLQESVDGIDAVLKICISSEHGKINVNEIFDFKKQEVKKEYEILLSGLEIKGKLKPGAIYKKLVEYLKKRKKKLDDITELYEIKGFENLDIFYDPPKNPVKKKGKIKPNTTLALQDIFTIWSGDDKLDPLFFSDALCAIFGIRRPHANDARTLNSQFKEFIASFKENFAHDWDKNWQYLEPIYQDKPKFLDKVKNIFSKQFGPKVFSVLSYGKVGQVEQKLLAIIKKIEHKDNKQDQDNQGQQGEKKEEEEESASKRSFEVVRVYWL